MSRNEALFEAARRVLPGGVSSPVRAFKSVGGTPLTLRSGKGAIVKDADGHWSPGFEFVDSHTVRAHPFIIDALLVDAERLWTMDEVLDVLKDTAEV